MTRVSTSLTIFLKLFIPTFWIVFFGIFTIAVWLTDETIGPLSFISFKIGLTAFFLFGIFMLYLVLMRLKRVEMDDEFIYVTNYFKTFRYPYHNIKKIRESDFLILKTVRIFFKEKGYFGKSIFFVASRKNLQHFLEEHTNVVEQLIMNEE